MFESIVTRKYNKKTDDALLIALCPKDSAGRQRASGKTAEKVKITKLLDPNLKYDAVVRAMARLIKAGKLLAPK